MKLSTTHQIIIGCAAALLVLVLLSQIAYRTANTVGESSELITRAQSVLLYSDNLSAQLERLDQEVRRMVETGATSGDDSYRTRMSTVFENLELLETYASPDSPHLEHFVFIRRLIETKIARLDPVLDGRVTAPAAVETALAVSEQGTGEVASEIRQLQRVELENLTTSTVDESLAATKAKYSILLVSIGAVVFLVIGASLIVNDLKGRKRAETNLRASEDRFRTLAANAPIGIFLTDTDGRIEFLNERYAAITRIPAREILGHVWTEAVHANDRNAVVGEWEQALGKDDYFESEYRSNTKDGQVAWIHGRFAPLCDEEGSLNGFIGTVTDMTSRKQSEAERDRFFNMSQDLLSISDFEGHLHRFNPSWTEHLGFNVGELNACSLMDIVHPDDLEATRKVWARLAFGGTVTRFENRVRTSGGGYRQLSWSAAADVSQKLIYAIARDVTESGKPAAGVVPAGEQLSPNPVMPQGSPRNVLVIEGSDSLAERIVAMLDHNTIGSRVARNGIDAVEIASSEQFDAIILDLKFPDMEGREILKIIRNSETNRTTPVIAILSPADRNIIPTLHIQGFVEKPVDVRHLSEALWRAGLSRPIPTNISTS